tara:strand:- start:40 stop:258 length:219 start_codon:yes stop_codon:yes gene_type:complete
MHYSQSSPKFNSTLNPANKSPAGKAMEMSDTLQDLIDILQQNYLSDCSYCAGSGKTLNKQSCSYCAGRGKRR